MKKRMVRFAVTLALFVPPPVFSQDAKPESETAQAAKKAEETSSGQAGGSSAGSGTSVGTAGAAGGREVPPRQVL